MVGTAGTDPRWLAPLTNYPHAEGRGEQRRGLRTKALMRDLGTTLACRHRVFVTTEKKHCGNKSIVAKPDSNLLPTGQ